MIVLNTLSKTERQEVFSYLEEQNLGRGESLFLPEDAAGGVYFIKSGRLGVQTETGFEDRKQVVALLDEGAPVGEKGLADKSFRKMSVTAIEDTTLYYLSAADFAEIENNNPALAILILKKILAITALRLQSCSQRLAHIL